MNPESMSDKAFLEALESATYPKEQFGHRAHLRLGWLCLREQGFEEGLASIRTRIQRYATAVGAAAKYHETMTRVWAEHVQAALDATPELTSFDAFLAAHPELLNAGLLERHYRKETLGSAEAKTGWVPPDREPLPRRKQTGK
ncbi:hypothetical protein [Hyalangium rubrum]|uniref:Uncharacterized protein n=1 Tax=Hyalangium rubrum TaxID=3103134 RepID=A0ABU5HH78_9BACT|nr:hypothetical protein [Hyalangium sp. s54d21]MDY7231445.1 hypothetical protein [Hyalangium sp. s54d21]